MNINNLNDDYKIGDIVFTIANGGLIKTKIIKLYKGHVGVYSGEWVPYEKLYDEIARSKEELFNKLKYQDLSNVEFNY